MQYIVYNNREGYRVPVPEVVIALISQKYIILSVSLEGGKVGRIFLKK